jgi:hypothetical protein
LKSHTSDLISAVDDGEIALVGANEPVDGLLRPIFRRVLRLP